MISPVARQADLRIENWMWHFGHSAKADVALWEKVRHRPPVEEEWDASYRALRELRISTDLTSGRTNQEHKFRTFVIKNGAEDDLYAPFQAMRSFKTQPLL
jgi:hypothetical protein